MQADNKYSGAALFLVTSITESPGDRLRVGQFLPYLEKQGFQCRVSNFYSRKVYHQISGMKKPLVRFLFFVIWGLLKTTYALLFTARKCDLILIRKQSIPFAPWFYLKLLLDISDKPLIYDFDDAVFTYVDPERGKLATLLKNKLGKTDRLIQYSSTVIAGNEKLAEYAKKLNRRVALIPTAVDTDRLIPSHKSDRNNQISVGWVGTLSTSPYLKSIKTVLLQLQRDLPQMIVRIITHRDARADFAEFDFQEWSQEREPELVSSLDIGLMPLPNNRWTEGKSGFKILLYFAVGIPAIVSPVGVNRQIVQNGENGLWAESDDQWYDSIKRLVMDFPLRNKMGAEGRKLVESKFSVKICVELFTNVIASALPKSQKAI
ncbi:MAG: glycosyltransferase family 4 protein [candidate division Zixibacteria bacterium]|nr:glycosyltransferase family 4 protein [candidate division Zixibacteria bacterium]